jgi:hypothetical protein
MQLLDEQTPKGPVQQVAYRLRHGAIVDDETFDELLSPHAQKKSTSYWSPVAAAQQAARLFHDAGSQRILDVGSGSGKFCSVASLTLDRRIWGLERRGSLVLESRRLAQTLGAEVVIIEGGLEAIEPREFDGFYFFNPFGEYVADDADRYDAEFPRSFEGYVADARRVERWLREAPLGTALITHHGLGGRIPASFEVRHTERFGKGIMRLWVKERAEDHGQAFFEIEEELITAEELVKLAATPDAEPLIAELCRPSAPTPGR